MVKKDNKIDMGNILFIEYITEQWLNGPLNKEGYYVIKDINKETNTFNKWKGKYYPDIDLDDKWVGNDLVGDIKKRLLKRGIIYN